MDNFPDSGHPLDERRFYVFAKTVARYRNKKWRDYSYFEKCILEHTPHFDKEDIEKFWSRLRELVEFHSVNPIPTVSDDGEKRHGLYQRGIKGGKMYEVQISEAEYFGKETIKRATYF